MGTITFTDKLFVQECCACFMTFGVPERFDAKRREDHKSFFCPNGHSQSYTGKSEADRLRDQLAAEKHAREQADAMARDRAVQLERTKKRLAATQGVVTRHKKKISAGTCPCCSAQFKNLEAHMKNRHPKWDPTKEAEVRTDG